MKTKYQDLGDRPFVNVPVLDERAKSLPVDVLDGLVYGFLIFSLGHRDQRRWSTTRTALATSLRMDKKAVDRSVSRLLTGGAVHEEGGRVIAVQPSGYSEGWFRRHSKAPAVWRESFVYDRVYLPKSHTVLSIKANALFWHLVKLGHAVDGMPGYLQVGGHPKDHMKYLSAKYLANGLGVYRRTVVRGLRRLRELELITIQQMSRTSFVIGIPPIASKAGLWCEEFGKGQRNRRSEITAESLFGVPSDDVLSPATDYSAGAALHVRGHGITGKVAEEIVTKIVKYQIPPTEWRPLLTQASRDHDNNYEKDPSRLKAKHCGFLFHYMLKELLKQQEAARNINGDHSYMSHAEMESGYLLEDVRLTPEGMRLLRVVIEKEYLELRDGGCVPCRVSWESVLRVLKEEKKDFAAFKQEIARLIFKTSEKMPSCDWYDRWMAAEQIPTYDNSQMEALGLGHKDMKSVRDYADILAKRQCPDGDIVALKKLVNQLVRLGCERAKGPMACEVEAGINEVYRELFPKKSTVGP